MWVSRGCRRQPAVHLACLAPAHCMWHLSSPMSCQPNITLLLTAPRLLRLSLGRRCTVHNCERHGVAIFGGLDGSRASAVLEACELKRNKGIGLLVRDGATPTVTDTTISRNGSYGMYLQDCGGSYSRNVVVENGEGAVGYMLLFESFSVNELVVENKLDRYPQKLTPLRK